MCLDGELAVVEGTPHGLSFAAGPLQGSDADHAVLWSREEFAGELMVTFDYTRIDSAERDVNTLYLHARGTGIGPYVPDLIDWSELRRVPAMRLYFQNLNAWHLSYAAFVNEGPVGQPDYLRVRRYPVTPERSFDDTEVPPAYTDTGLFLTGRTYSMTVLKTAACLFLQVRDGEETRLYRWDVSRFCTQERGRIGLRHMHGRSAVYGGLKVFERTYESGESPIIDPEEFDPALRVPSHGSQTSCWERRREHGLPPDRRHRHITAALSSGRG